MGNYVPKRTAQGGMIYSKVNFTDAHGDTIRVARVATMNGQTCRVTCLDSCGDDQALVLDKAQAADLIAALTEFLIDPNPAVRLV